MGSKSMEKHREKQEIFELLEGFLNPRSVAVVGATPDVKKGGYALVANLLGYCGERLYPVNPKYKEICGTPCYPSVEELPEVVDLAILFVPAREVPELITRCGRKGVSRVMIQSAGFAETGEQGRRLQERCLAEARGLGIRIWGPNCMGAVNGRTRMVASFMRPHVWEEILRPGDVSVIVQSGMASAGFLMQVMSEGYFGLSKACSIGNRSDINECDLLEYFAWDPDTAVVAMYLESVSDPPRFRKAVENLGKPLILLRGGISRGGAMAALSHTGSLAGNVGVAEGFFRQLGILRAYDFLELMDLTKALSTWKGKKGGKRVAVVTFSGAAGIVASDHLESCGMALAELSPITMNRLQQVFPPWMEPSNPVDIWPAIERRGRQRAYQESLGALVQDPGVEAVHVHMYVDRPLLEGSWELLEPLFSWQGRAALWLIGDTRCFRELREKVEPMGIPVYGEIQRGIRALSLNF
jgi:acyl-CoA synthetase (NDP forming)